jgi:hypothetical protein
MNGDYTQDHREYTGYRSYNNILYIPACTVTTNRTIESTLAIGDRIILIVLVQ